LDGPPALQAFGGLLSFGGSDIGQPAAGSAVNLKASGTQEIVLNEGIIMISEVENAYGCAFTPQELGKMLKLDRRTVIKYAKHWGGVEVAPGTWRFFEKRIKEALNAEQGFEKRHIAIQGKCDGSGTYGTKAVSGREQKVTSRGSGLGKRSKKRTGEEAIPDKFGIFSGRAVG
jgi:hypothetical protein